MTTQLSSSNRAVPRDPVVHRVPSGACAIEACSSAGGVEKPSSMSLQPPSIGGTGQRHTPCQSLIQSSVSVATTRGP